VLEPRLISTLIPGIEQFIQIGDHQQLRPQISNYALSLNNPNGNRYQLDRSHFERLVFGQSGLAPVPVAQLGVHCRLQPAISRLIRETMDRQLEDHDNVNDLPNIVGM